MKDLKQRLEDMRKIPEVKFSGQTEESFGEVFQKNVKKVIKNIQNYLAFFIEHYGEREQEDHLKRLPKEIIIPDKQVDYGGVIISDREMSGILPTVWYVTTVPGEFEFQDNLYGVCVYVKRDPKNDEEKVTICLKDKDGELWSKDRGSLEEVSMSYRRNLVWGLETPSGFASRLLVEEQEKKQTAYRETLEYLLRAENLMRAKINELHANGLFDQKYEVE